MALCGVTQSCAVTPPVLAETDVKNPQGSILSLDEGHPMGTVPCLVLCDRVPSWISLRGCCSASRQERGVTSFALLFVGFFFVVLKAHLIILRLRTQCPSLGENAWDKGWVMDDPIPLLSAVTIISYPSCSSSVSLSSGPVLWGSE